MYGTPITILRFSWVHDEDDILAHVTLSEPHLGVPVWKDWAVTAEQKAYFEKGTNAVACLVQPRRKAAGKDRLSALRTSSGRFSWRSAIDGHRRGLQYIRPVAVRL